MTRAEVEDVLGPGEEPGDKDVVLSDEDRKKDLKWLVWVRDPKDRSAAYIEVGFKDGKVAYFAYGQRNP